MAGYTEWTMDDAASLIAVPGPDDDKYSRGVLGVIAGSARYPGAAVLSVEAALRTGLGMVRFFGQEKVAELVIQRRPEVVCTDGRVQAWLIGSGMDAADRDADTQALCETALGSSLPLVLDAGAIDLFAAATGPVVITPHYRELARLLMQHSPAGAGAPVPVTAADIAVDPGAWALRAAEQWGITVLLKGSRSYVASPGARFVAGPATPWLATAGTGDVLGGILGALVATHGALVSTDESALAQLAATASVIHGLAAARASAGGPFTALELAAEVPAVIADFVAR